MLNVKALTELLSENRDGRLCKAWYLMTANGTLLAYSQPTRVLDLRRQAALAALSWQEHDRERATEQVFLPRESIEDSLVAEDEDRRRSSGDAALQTLIIESETANIIMRRLQSRLLLVLEGGLPPGRSGAAATAQITAEAADGSVEVFSAITGAREVGGEERPMGRVLQVQREKVNTLATIITREFEQSGFVMPDDGGVVMF